MKKLILALSVAALLGMAAQAQDFNKEALLQKIAKNEAAAADAKKSTKAATWINLAKSYIDAAIQPTKGLYLSDDPNSMLLDIQVMALLGEPNSIEEVVLNKTPMMALVYDYVTVYSSDSQVAGWKQTAEVFDGAIEKALSALDKAYELDPKQASKIREQLVRIDNFCAEQGNTLNEMGEFRQASEAFETAFRAEMNPAFGTPDLTRLYYAGMLATAGGSADHELFKRGEEMLLKAREMGYVDEDGQFYYFLYHCYYGQRTDDPANVQKAKETLLEGITKFPNNQELLTSLINLYSTEEGLGDPSELIEKLDATIANDPRNIELWFGRAQIFVELKNYDEAIASLQKAIEIDPTSYQANFFTGYYFIMKADALNEEANAKRYTSMEEANADQEVILSAYAEAIPFLEKAHEIDATQLDPVALLRALTFRLRDREGMMEKNQAYNALYEQMQQQ